MIPAAGAVQNLSNDTAFDGIRRIAEWNLGSVLSSSANNLTLSNDTLRVTVVLKQSSAAPLAQAVTVDLYSFVRMEGAAYNLQGFNTTIDPFLNVTEVYI